MNPEIKREWVAALRSGEYKQARNKLCTEGGAMCCLGVLVDSCVDGEWEHYTRDGYAVGRGYRFGNRADNLTREVRSQVGLKASDQGALSAMNDGANGYHAHSFAEIADWIEKNL